MIIANQVKDHLLLSDQMSPNMAKEVVGSIIDREINFYKIQMLKHWVHNHNTDEAPYQRKLKALYELKSELAQITEKANAGQYQLKVDTTLDIELVK